MLTCTLLNSPPGNVKAGGNFKTMERGRSKIT
jgi:hypothetical protein